MTTITLFTRKTGEIEGFSAVGHSGYAEAGDDIVCAAISALTQAAEYGMKEVIGMPVDRAINEKRGHYSLNIGASATSQHREQAQILLKTMAGSLQAIEREYPRNIRIIFQERR